MNDVFQEFQGRRNKKHLLKITQLTSTNVGIEGEKGEAKVQYAGDRRIVDMNDMFVKESKHAKRAHRAYELLQELFQKAMDEGKVDYIPLPPTMAVNGRRLVMTEMTEKGKKVIVDRHTERLMDMGEINWDYRISNIDESLDLIKLVHEIANEGGIYLTYDSYSLIVDKASGVGRPYFLDLGHVAPFSESLNVLGYDSNEVREIDTKNLNEFSKFIGGFRYFINNIKENK